MTVTAFHDTPAVEHALRIYAQQQLPVPAPEPEPSLPAESVTILSASTQDETLAVGQGPHLLIWSADAVGGSDRVSGFKPGLDHVRIDSPLIGAEHAWRHLHIQPGQDQTVLRLRDDQGALVQQIVFEQTDLSQDGWWSEADILCQLLAPSSLPATL